MIFNIHFHRSVQRLRISEMSKITQLLCVFGLSEQNPTFGICDLKSEKIGDRTNILHMKMQPNSLLQLWNSDKIITIDQDVNNEY